ncbi:MAG: NAD(P)/FAD-dependent oxidoreductase [Pyrinomonadaceae bacterium]
MNQKVIIIGAGLAGSLLAIYLAKRGMSVDVYEARGDMRLEEVAAGRSINLALSDRGIAALREVGMDQYMLAEAVPMNGRMIHPVAGKKRLLPYSGRMGEYINSVSRGGLNAALISEAERYPNVRFIFNRPCVDFDWQSGEVKFDGYRTATGDSVIATDGAGSAVRQAMAREVNGIRVSSDFLDHGYKELVIPSAAESGLTPSQGGSDGFLIEKNALHIWPRHKFMMIALPNFDSSFTCTLFLAHKDESGTASYSNSEPSFERLSDKSVVEEFFQNVFPDALPLMPTLASDFFTNPTGKLGTLRSEPWNIDGKVLLLGDAAHAMVPFYGQGMNCAFEDVRVLDSLIGKHGAIWETVYDEYVAARKPNTDAIQDMAVENFYEMRDAVADPVFLRKRKLETRLEQTFPEYFSKYSMVTFREDMPYSTAKEKGNKQDRLLMEICRETTRFADLDLQKVFEMVKDLK